jgi:hypothetical protein
MLHAARITHTLVEDNDLKGQAGVVIHGKAFGWLRRQAGATPKWMGGTVKVLLPEEAGIPFVGNRGGNS